MQWIATFNNEYQHYKDCSDCDNDSNGQKFESSCKACFSNLKSPNMQRK